MPLYHHLPGIGGETIQVLAPEEEQEAHTLQLHHDPRPATYADQIDLWALEMDIDAQHDWENYLNSIEEATE